MARLTTACHRAFVSGPTTGCGLSHRLNVAEVVAIATLRAVTSSRIAGSIVNANPLG